MTVKSVQESAEHVWRSVKVSLRRWWSRGEWEGKLAEPFHATVEWWEGGCTPPPPTERKRQLLHELWCQHRMGTAVETGTFVGDTTAFLAERCARVITIELDPDLAARARARFEDQPGVTVVEGDSGALLGGLLDDLDEPALFWLDGHFSGPHEGIPTARGRTDTPLLEELKALADWKHAKDSVVLIDDARLIGVGDYPSFDEIREVVRAIGDQSVSISCDAVVIQPFRILPQGLA
jgi:hypothetical protein